MPSGFDPGAGGGASDEEVLRRWDEANAQDQGSGDQEIPAADVGSYKAYQAAYGSGPVEGTPEESYVDPQQYEQPYGEGPVEGTPEESYVEPAPEPQPQYDEHPQVGYDAGDTT